MNLRIGLSLNRSLWLLGLFVSTIFGASYPLQSLAAGLSKKDVMVAAAERSRGNLDKQLQAAYALIAENDPLSIVYLERASKIAPANAKILEQMGYARLKSGDYAGAASDFKSALQLEPENPKLRKQLVYTEDALGKRRAAAIEARGVALSGSQFSADGCRAWSNLVGLPDRIFPKPWFAEAYAAPEYRTVGHVAVVPLQMRLGYFLLGDDTLSAYASWRLTRDNRSGRAGVSSEIYFDNTSTIAGGLRLRPYGGLPLYLFSEFGAAQSLVAEKDGEAWKRDVRVGAVFGTKWQAQEPACGSTAFAMTPVVDVYSEAIWYSRYENLIGFARARAGFRVLESKDFNVEIYSLAALNSDSAGRRDNRFYEVGFGMAFNLLDPLRLTIRAEGVEVKRSLGGSLFDRRLRLEQEARF